MNILIYLLISLFTHRKRRETLEGLAVFLPAILCHLLWKFVSGIYVTGGQFASSRFAPELIQEYLTGGAPEYKYNATILFLRKLVTVNLINSYLPLAFIGLFMLMIAATIGIPNNSQSAPDDILYPSVALRYSSLPINIALRFSSQSISNLSSIFYFSAKIMQTSEISSSLLECFSECSLSYVKIMQTSEFLKATN